VCNSSANHNATELKSTKAAISMSTSCATAARGELGAQSMIANAPKNRDTRTDQNVEITHRTDNCRNMLRQRIVRSIRKLKVPAEYQSGWSQGER
jgi:hypothetical protein